MIYILPISTCHPPTSVCYTQVYRLLLCSKRQKRYSKTLRHPGSQICFRKLCYQSTNRVDNKSTLGPRFFFLSCAETACLVQVSEFNRPFQGEAVERDGTNMPEQVRAIDQERKNQWRLTGSLPSRGKTMLVWHSDQSRSKTGTDY